MSEADTRVPHRVAREIVALKGVECRYWTRTFPVDHGFHPWDSAAIAWLRRPELFVAEARGWRLREVHDATNGSGKATWWLECDPDYPGNRVTYCTGFADGGKRAFVRDVVTTVY